MIICFVILNLPFAAASQITAVEQKCLNAYVEYANQSADEVTGIVKTILDYYPNLGSKNAGPARYVCPFQLDDYYATNAEKQKQSLGTVFSTPIDQAFKKLREVELRLDQKCKALDTYHKLEDYKQDNFTNARKSIDEIQDLLIEYRKEQRAFQSTLESVYKKLPVPSTAYRHADIQMLSVIGAERNFVDSWLFNLKEEIHTGWDVEKLMQSLLESSNNIEALTRKHVDLKYPAASMWTQFQSSVSSMLEVKQRGLDEYNFEAKKSDRHSNQIYLELINYLNGTLIADYNTFIEFAERDGYYGLKTIKYVPAFEGRLRPVEVHVDVKTFKDIPKSTLVLTPEKSPVSKVVFECLSSYVDFINETWRQTRYMQSALASFNSSAAYYKTLETFDKRGPMHFDYSDYHLPLSAYQTTVSSSRVLPPMIAKLLNEQTAVLLNILKEMDGLGASLDTEVKQKKYEQDHLNKVYSILERQAELFRIWDDKKEMLYQDVRTLYNNYPTSDAGSSWQISGKALRDLADLDRDALFKAKAYYLGDSGLTISTDKIDIALREVISKEYEHMKGIQKIGRNNGLCPYTPYEDLPETSKQLSDHFKKLKPAVSASLYNHPYHSMVYLYNEIADDYNKFCELSTTIHHLKTIKQPELFQVKYPDTKPADGRGDFREKPNETPIVTNTTVNIPEVNAKAPVSTADRSSVIRDTIYIEKRDTVYLTASAEDLRSMDGFATNNMVLLLDVSGSMNQPGKLPLLKQSVFNMLSMMRTEDNITIIAFSGKPKILLKPTSFKEEEKIKKAVADLASSGKTDGNAALKMAYKVADENYLRGGNNRIILATDGEFVVNDEVRLLIERFSNEDIFLSVFNFGKGAGSSKDLERLASIGKGNYEAISKENVEVKLIREAKAKRKK